MNPHDTQVDLTNCDREPIHILGNIQDFGALVAVNADWAVVHHSANFDAMLGRDTAVAPGTPLKELFPDAAMRRLGKALEEMGSGERVERLFALDLGNETRMFDVALHVTNRMTIIEFEPHDAQKFGEHVAMLRPDLGSLEKEEGVLPLCRAAARRLKRNLGFDRVMVYRFHEDLSGEVIAEAREGHLESYLNLRYPKTDIPAQARELYLRNPFRIISDVNADPVPIVPQTSLEGEPLDLSLSTLRAVSPIHIEYLRNIGVDASLSVSIIIDGKLWGLFACHHYSPRVLPFSLRTAAEMFSKTFSLLLELRLHSLENDLTERGRDLHNQLMARMAGGTGLSENLPTIETLIEDIIPHDGSSIFIDGKYHSRGAAPNEEEFRSLVPALNSGSTSRVFGTKELAAAIPAARAFAQRAAGALVIPVSRRPRDYYVLWRRELPQTVTWAGNPEKPVEHGPNGARLTPRKSFDAWRQSVTGQSQPWTDAEKRIAESLRVTLLEVILRLTDTAMQERNRAQEQQELLIAELNHRVRNILNLIRSLIGQSRHDAKDVDSFADIIGGRINALATAHDQITDQHWSPASVKDLIRSEAQAYLSRQSDRVILEGPDMLVSPEAFTVLALVVHEMMTNSAKYGSLCDHSGTLTIGLSLTDNQDLRIDWRERGGPPVKPPERRGFGTTIIEKSIPFELKGSAEIRYRLSGVEAAFEIPGKFVSASKGKDDAGGKAVQNDPQSTPALAADEIPAHVLVVEDNMIIAIDTEDSLRELGVGIVTVCNSVESALKAIDKDAPEFAILDYNLGDQSSDPVADRLKTDGIRFVLATGYGELVDELEAKGAAGLLKKPYGKSEIAEILSQPAD